MTDSSKRPMDYAPNHASTPTSFAQEVSDASPASRGFRTRFLPTLAALVLVALFLAAGQWQWNKAAAKNGLQLQLDLQGAESALALPATQVDVQTIRFRKIIAYGRYEPQFQILIDNRTYRGQAGFHVITPLRIEGSNIRVLVNRGWIPALAEHHLVPQFDTPPGLVEVVGTAIIPPARFFTLGAKTSASKDPAWQLIWQNLDLARFERSVDFPVQPVVVQLDGASDAGGFAREWPRPDNRADANLGYALQWWAFAATTVALWLFFTFRRKTKPL